MKKILFALALFFAAPAHAVESVYLEDLTWPEVKARMEKGTNTIIIPTGGTEQNGPHIAIGKHNWIVRYTSGEIARTLGNTLAAPVLDYVPEGNISPPEGHMKFPGTISLSEEHFAAVLEDTARSFKQHGFKHICFIGDHGGSQNAQQQVADKLNKEWAGSGVTVIQVGDYYTDKPAEDWVKEKKIKVEDPAAHAGFMDASEVMALNKSGVSPSQFKHFSEKDFDATGAKGDPTLATAEYGKALLAFKVKAAVNQIKRGLQ